MQTAVKVLKKDQKQVDDWNARYPPGTPVNLHLPNERGNLLTKTASRAIIGIKDGKPIIWVEGKFGHFSLADVTPVAMAPRARRKVKSNG
jgi:hypothetical protein